MRPFAQAAEQNKEPIAKVLGQELRQSCRVLELGSGTGQHAVHFCAEFPWLQWQPSELPDQLAGIEAWRMASALPNLLPAVALDVEQRPWPVTSVDAIYSANTLHIMNWRQVEALFAGSGELLRGSGLLCLYGPFHYGGKPTSESNARFDLYLRDKYPGGGVRNFEDLDQLARTAGMRLHRDAEMPTNNRLLFWRKD